MTRFKLSTLSFALLGALALTACDNTTDTAATDTGAYTPDTTADTQPIDDTLPATGVEETGVTDEYGTQDPATTMGDVNDLGQDDLENQDPMMNPQTDPMDPTNTELDPAEPVEDTPTPQ